MWLMSAQHRMCTMVGPVGGALSETIVTVSLRAEKMLPHVLAPEQKCSITRPNRHCSGPDQYQKRFRYDPLRQSLSYTYHIIYIVGSTLPLTAGFSTVRMVWVKLAHIYCAKFGELHSYYSYLLCKLCQTCHEGHSAIDHWSHTCDSWYTTRYSIWYACEVDISLLTDTCLEYRQMSMMWCLYMFLCFF